MRGLPNLSPSNIFDVSPPYSLVGAEIFSATPSAACSLRLLLLVGASRSRRGPPQNLSPIFVVECSHRLSSLDFMKKIQDGKSYSTNLAHTPPKYLLTGWDKGCCCFS
ncbi:unnamed protein product [Microthlaspi erraticum]|uniref:Uncharacterized protein n=1 Tax=Microthlaspi erraticum TaxID=1685480 RepID=A0A6D2HVM5_9BRAS|nr:unnamed protein product [Microthlaspi erraticum]